MQFNNETVSISQIQVKTKKHGTMTPNSQIRA